MIHMRWRILVLIMKTKVWWFLKGQKNSCPPKNLGKEKQ